MSDAADRPEGEDVRGRVIPHPEDWLPFVDTDDLVDELRGRFDGFVLIAERDAAKGGPIASGFCTVHGGSSRALGMVETAKAMILRERLAMSGDGGEEDDEEDGEDDDGGGDEG